ncbi:hypothetical protein GE09DRAFT_123981 [Coniochaeta sp. 2T2.1]|nr:hypothetical protein GE09DRAFT_123981 [Coniochaeta sp. 2T2.1]
MLKCLILTALLVGSSVCQRTRTRTQTQTQGSGTQTLYGQCGGKNWSGPVACPTGAYCKNDGVNEWYSQCVAIEANQPVGDSPITTSVRTTITVVGPTPTVVTTFITYLTPTPPPTVTTITLVPDDPYIPDWP